jgi:hypothetical protein
MSIILKIADVAVKEENIPLLDCIVSKTDKLLVMVPPLKGRYMLKGKVLQREEIED